MGPSGSAWGHIKTGQSPMAHNHFKTPLTPRRSIKINKNKKQKFSRGGHHQIPPSIPKEVTDLTMTGNDIPTINDCDFWNYSQLVVLKLHTNRMRRIDEHAFGWTPLLEFIAFQGNRLETFPNISNLLHLKILRLRDNMIQCWKKRLLHPDPE